MSRRSVRKRRHLVRTVTVVGLDAGRTFSPVRVMIGDVDVTESFRAVSYRDHRKLLERRVAISLGLAFDGTYRWPDLSGRGAS